MRGWIHRESESLGVDKEKKAGKTRGAGSEGLVRRGGGKLSC